MKIISPPARKYRLSNKSRLDVAAALVAIIMVAAVVVAFAAYETRPDDWGYAGGTVVAAT